MKLEDKINRLLSETTAYDIQKTTGVSQNTLGKINRKEAKIENLSLKNAQALADEYDKRLIQKLQATIGQQKYVELIAFLTRNFNEIVSSQRDVTKSDEGYPSELIMANILEADFKERLTDPLFIAQCATIIDKIK